jgi:hypothetical protein
MLEGDEANVAEDNTDILFEQIDVALQLPKIPGLGNLHCSLWCSNSKLW